MFRRSKLTAAAAVLIGSMLVGNVYACACCSEPGTYAVWSGKLQKYEMEIVRQIRFETRASIFMTEAGFDTIKGLSAIERDVFETAAKDVEGDLDLAGSFSGKFWTLIFKTGKGRSGTLRLPIPARLSTFKVDIHDGSDKGLGPLLYKEYRFTGTVAAGTGFFAASTAKPTTFSLIFQGRGLACDEVTDFRNWNLEISGPRADYQFYGRLASAGENKDANAAATRPPPSLLTLQ